MAISYAVNEDLSISIGKSELDYELSTVDNQESTSINASYTMGAASVRATVSDSNNDAGVTGAKDEHMELSLVLAF